MVPQDLFTFCGTCFSFFFNFSFIEDDAREVVFDKEEVRRLLMGLNVKEIVKEAHQPSLLLLFDNFLSTSSKSPGIY